MNDHRLKRRLPSLPGILAGSLVAIGIFLWMFVSKSLIIVAGLGAFGPGILREFGWLKDHDEFQRQSAHRAGYHAYLVGGLAAVAVISALEWSAANLDNSAEWIRYIVVVLWASWMFSALLSYWGARKTASAVLITFGSFWAVFVIASGIGEYNPETSFWEAALGTSIGAILIAAFFVPAWTAHRWPRATGLVLLFVSFGFLLMFGGKGGLQWSTVALTNTLLLGPLIVSGVALLREQRKHSPGSDDED